MDEKLIRSIGTKRPCREKCTPPGKKPKLNDNQKIVLEWLKWQSKQNGTDPTDSIYLLVYGEVPSSVSTALIDLTKAQQFKVLAAFAEWGNKSNE